jgi:hypothetical protein
MQVTVVVGDQERRLGEGAASGAAEWTLNAEQADRAVGTPLAEDEAELLDELTRLCRGILLEEGLAYPAD